MQFPFLQLNHRINRQVRQNSENTDDTSMTSFIYKTILNSPKMFRWTAQLNSKNSTNYDHSSSLFQDPSMSRLESVQTLSAPNTPSTKRNLLPRWQERRYKWHLYIWDMVVGDGFNLMEALEMIVKNKSNILSFK